MKCIRKSIKDLRAIIIMFSYFYLSLSLSFFLLKECQSLIEENRRLSGLTQTIDSVQNVVLQTKIETLQWQLDQVRFTFDY